MGGKCGWSIVIPSCLEDLFRTCSRPVPVLPAARGAASGAGSGAGGVQGAAGGAARRLWRCLVAGVGLEEGQVIEGIAVRTLRRYEIR